MIFVGRLFGFVVVLVLIGAVVLNVADKIDVDGVVELASINLTVSDFDKESLDVYENEVLEETVEHREDLPIEFRSGSTVKVLNKVEIGTHNDFKELIFNEHKVLVLLNNEYLKNPYIPFDRTFLVTLTGYNNTHFFSDGAEIGGNNFTYLADDLMRVFILSGSQAWIYN